MDNDMPEHKWFYFKHGKRASNIEELKNILESISESEFTHHVTVNKNDFANWVEHVFGEKKLANDMRESGDKEGIIALLGDFLSQNNELPLPQTVIPPEHPKHHHKKAAIKEEKKLFPDYKEESLVSEDEFYGKDVPEPGLSEKEPFEKELSEKEIKALVDEAMLVFDSSSAKKEPENDKEELRIIGKAGDEETDETEETEEGAEADTGEEEWAPNHKPSLEIEKPTLEKEPSKKEHHKFMVEEFLYGFIMGLIFGLIMLGVILQLRVT